MSVYFEDNNCIRTKVSDLNHKIRERYGVELVFGFEKPVCADFCETEEFPIASYKHIRKAWKIRRKGKGRFSFLSFALPEILSAEYVVFAISIGTGYGAAYPQPSGYFTFTVNGEHAIDFHETKYSKYWENGQCSLYYDVMRCEVAPKGCSLSLDPYIHSERMASFGVCFLKMPASKFKSGQQVKIEVSTFEYYPSDAWIRIDQPNTEESLPYIFACLNFERGLSALLKEKKAEKINGFSAYLGDIHTHSFCGVVCPCDWAGEDKKRNCTDCKLMNGQGTGCGYGTVSSNYYNARYVSGLDFYCLTDHDFQLSDEDWLSRVHIANRRNEDGKFATLNGYEYTSWWHGHRNIYFRADHPVSICRAVPYKEPYGGYIEKPVSDLFAFYKKRNERILSVPHHPTAADHCFSWDSFNSEYEKMVEVFSGWGNSEGEDGPLIGNGSNKIPELCAAFQLKAGKQFGFIASSDSHDGFPGLSQGSGIYNFGNKFTEASSGKTIALCSHLTRTEIFDAIDHRRAYATTGAPIYATFFVNDGFMGDMITAKKQREISLMVNAPSEIEKIQIVKNGKTIYRQWCDNKTETITYIDNGREYATDCYYARVILKDGEMAWISPVWVQSA